MKQKKINTHAANDNTSNSDNEKKLMEFVLHLSHFLGRNTARKYWSDMNAANDNEITENNSFQKIAKEEEN